MDRLAYVTLHTAQLERLKTFYTQQIGLGVRFNSDSWVEFDSAGATLALHAAPDPGRVGIELAFVVPSVEDRVRRLESRGVRIAGGTRLDATGNMAEFRDPDGVVLSVIAPGTPYRDGDGMRLSTAIIHCRDLHAAKAFYRNVLAMHVVKDGAVWVEFDNGDAHLALQSRVAVPRSEASPVRPVTFALVVDDLMAWSDRHRDDGLMFASAPHDTPFGLMAEVADPDGNLLVLHEPVREAESSPVTAVEDDALSARSAVRKPPAVRAKGGGRTTRGAAKGGAR